MSKLVIETQYFPCIAYFATILKFEEVWIDLGEFFEKQTYRNRCEILMSNGTQSLTIPVHQANSKQITKDVKIDNTQKWLNHHWRTFSTAYGNAPFFDYFADEIQQAFLQKHTFLWEFNTELLTLCLKLLKIPLKLKFSEKYIDLNENQDFTDFRSVFHPKKSIDLARRIDIPAYLQVFGKGFVNNLSILDALFCEGVHSLHILQSTSITQNEQDSSKNC